MSQPLKIEICVGAAKEQIVKRLRDKRKELGLTQEELAHGAGLNQTYIARFESGKLNPTLSNVLRLLCYLENEDRKERRTFCQKLMIPWDSVKTAKEHEPAADAIQYMLDGGFSQLPVLSKRYTGEEDPFPSEIVGMITDQSILRSGRDPGTSKVNEMMDAKPPCIISIRETPDGMRDLFKREQAVLVKGDRERIVGFISRVDLIEGLGARSDSSSYS